MGLDGCHPYFLYSLRDVLCVPLRILYNKSLKEGVVATQWLEACITAIHKKGPKNLASNYRPVSITSVICKMMKSIIRNHIVVHMSNNNLFANEQHSFVPWRECMTNLLSAMEDWSEAIELGLDTDAIYTDFAKASDSVPHKQLSLTKSQWNRRRRIKMDSIIFNGTTTFRVTLRQSKKCKKER